MSRGSSGVGIRTAHATQGFDRPPCLSACVIALAGDRGLVIRRSKYWRSVTAGTAIRE